MPPAVFPIVILDLLQRASTLRDEPDWKLFRPGIKIRVLYENPETGASAALLCYEPHTRLTAHTHLGYEHILILDGAQADENGFYPAGSFIVNGPHTTHLVTSDAGCVALVIRTAGVRFLS